MSLEDLSKPLTIDDIEFRVQSVNKGGYATLLVYKDARVDMNILDRVVGRGFWKREHITINGSMYCRVSIYNKEINEWVSMEDVGTPSNTEKEKGLSSDAFKRACFCWGIGRELYAYPVIKVKLNTTEFKNGKPTFDFKLKEWVWFTQFVDGKLQCLAAKDDKGKVRFTYGKPEGVAIKETPTKVVEEPIEEPKKATRKPRAIKQEELPKVIAWALEKSVTLDIIKTYYELSEAQEKELVAEIKEVS